MASGRLQHFALECSGGTFKQQGSPVLACSANSYWTLPSVDSEGTVISGVTLWRRPWSSLYVGGVWSGWRGLSMSQVECMIRHMTMLTARWTDLYSSSFGMQDWFNRWGEYLIWSVFPPIYLSWENERGILEPASIPMLLIGLIEVSRFMYTNM